MLTLHDYGDGIYAIDSGYECPNLAAIHFIVELRAVAIVDTGANHSVPRILQALEQLGLATSAVRYVVLTHIHLDHAGGAGQLMQACPNAELTVHPRGARHMADPSRLWEATVAVYGAAKAESVYGKIVPIDAARIIETPDGTRITLGARELLFLDTPGHARHHVAVRDSRSQHIFSGDIFGLSYRELDQDGRAFIVPTSSPTQFDPEAAHRSIERIVGHAPPAVYLTHFSQVRDVPRLAPILHRLIDAYALVGCAHAEPDAGRHDALRAGITAAILAEARSQGLRHSEDRILEVLGLDIELNAQGLGSWLDASARG